MLCRKLGTSLLVLAAVASLLALPALADSQARIVRLSVVEGNVQIDRAGGQGYEPAFLNMPITEGTRLWAKNDARAEVEFEDGSTVRIVSETIIAFPVLSLRDEGDKVSTVNVEEGKAYFNVVSSRHHEFTVNFGRERVTLGNGAHFRVDMTPTQATLAVFKGNVEIEDSSGKVEISKKQSVTFDLQNQGSSEIAKNFEEDSEDAWDKEQEQYHQDYLARNSYATNSPYSYGMSDLNYYGSYFSLPGYGQVWQPYFTDLAWNPFMDGAWLWYPGAGYTWVSSYPWGWTPYRYGTWFFAPGYGWVWQPGGWNSWASRPVVVNPPATFKQPQPPIRGSGPVVVGRGPALPSGPGAPPKRMSIRDETAGLGIRRGSVRDMGHVSRRVETTSPVSTVGRAPAPHPAPPVRIAPARPSFGGAPRMSTPAPRVSSPPSRGSSSPHG